MNEDRPILSAAKWRSMILVSRNIRHMRIFAGFSRRRASSDSGVDEDGNSDRTQRERRGSGLEGLAPPSCGQLTCCFSVVAELFVTLC